MRSILFIMTLRLLLTSGQSCEDKNSIDVSDGEVFGDGTTIKDGVAFPPKYVYTKNVSGEIRSRGCVCALKNCLRKCCPLGSVMYRKNCTEMPNTDILLKDGADLHYKDEFRRRVKLDTGKGLFVIHGRPCKKVFLEDDGDWYIQEDGKLYVDLPNEIPPWTLLDADKYCIDTFVFQGSDGKIQTRLDALACFLDETQPNHFEVRSACMLTSCAFILVTLLVYAWLPELRNIHGRVLMAYLLCLFLGFICMSTMQILLVVNNITISVCAALTIIIYFALESAFFWLNVMSFDIWWTFSGKGGMSLNKVSKRFFAYSLYAFGVPTILTIILVSLEFSGLRPHPLLPMIRRQGCFLYGKSKLLYLYGPMLILCLANIVFFIMTAVKIAQIKQQTAMLKSKESAMHDQHRKDKQRLVLYLKLFTVMGINWILEVVSALYPEAQGFWNFTDAYNVLIGVTIFIIFVCKRKIYRLIKKRYRQLTGQPMSRTQTVSTRTMSSRDDVRLSSVKY